ncbi:phosphotransferase [Demequina litorisediminis]|uniref:Phosphotransferase n=1 Tax=Demequina litorisediminis TaxID=1849022 RepID=A0ABQ6IEY7_9MICO|nr:phosphotransferase [Demequina litorisediminis]GMA35294.1 phosphotransferase [Demequina litorisediminis]
MSAHRPLDSGPPQAHGSISEDTVRALLAAQHPDLAGLPLGERFDGWDMAVFRLGDDYSVRLPRVEAAVGPLETETRLLAELGPGWDFPHPEVVRTGEPGEGYPWPWRIVNWMPGDTTDLLPLPDDAGAALGRAIADLHQIAPADAPYNPEQSLPLSERQADYDYALARLADARGPYGERLLLDVVERIWAEALAAPGPGEPVWSHADLHGSNVLAIDGTFAGIIDWGKMAACDRAVDLGFLYTVLPQDGVITAVNTYLEITGVDDAGLEARLHGVALTKALLWATLDRPLNVGMAWRALAELGASTPA